MVGSDLSSAEEFTSLFIQLGRYADADKLLETQIPAYEKLYGKNSIRLIEPFVNKGRILLARGDYTESERTAIRANQMAVEIYGDISTKTAPTQRLLSDIYYTLGDYDKALLNVTNAITSQEKQFGRDHIEVAKSLAQLALIKFYKGDNRNEVEKLMLEARDIIAAKLGKENPQYAEVIKNMAVLYISEKKIEIAFNSLTTAEEHMARENWHKIQHQCRCHLHAYRRCVLSAKKLSESRRVLQSIKRLYTKNFLASITLNTSKFFRN